MFPYGSPKIQRSAAYLTRARPLLWHWLRCRHHSEDSENNASRCNRSVMRVATTVDLVSSPLHQRPAWPVCRLKADVKMRVSCIV
jgi:hypothetical protein